MGNTQKDLKIRLLHLLPIKSVKDYFGTTGLSTDIIDQLSNKPLNDIYNFVALNFQSTRQNIFLFTLDKPFANNSIGSDFPITVFKNQSVNGTYSFWVFPKTTFSVYLDNPLAVENLEFLQPVLIQVQGKILTISFTKLEKNIQTYYATNRGARKNTVINNQENILNVIIEYLRKKFTIAALDFNKGIKELWDKDNIDCHKIQSKNPHSVRVETMDGTLTYKQKYPGEYPNVILTPLRSTQWKYLVNDDYLCDGFTADPSNGQISITKFPKNLNQVSNVINKILAGN